jgi:hypothetical protein
MKLEIYSKNKPFFGGWGRESWHFGEHALTIFRLEEKGIKCSWDACMDALTDV